MEWIDREGGVDVGVDKAFTIIAEGPPTIAAREINPAIAEEAATFLAKEKGLQLSAFPALYNGEPEAIRLKRAEAFTACWQHLVSRLDATLESMDSQVFSAILDLATKSHIQPSKLSSLSKYGTHRIPTGLVLAGGVNSADHVSTFPNLATFLKESGCYVALLQPHDMSKTAGDTINAVLKQLSGLDTTADQFEALAAWYNDEVGIDHVVDDDDDHMIGGSRSNIYICLFTAYKIHYNSYKYLALLLLIDAENDEEDDAAPGPSNNNNKKGKLRQRPTTLTGAHTAAKKAAQETNAIKPIVVIIEGTETVDANCLNDVISTLSEGYANMPVTLIIGLTTTASALSAMLPSQVLDNCLQCTHYKLATAINQLEMVVREVLLGANGGWPGLVMTVGVVDALWDRFLLHYFSSSIIKQGLQAAALSHFRTQPASFLASAALTGPRAIKTSAKAAPSTVTTYIRRHSITVTGGGDDAIANAVTGAMKGYISWAVAVLWTSTAGQAAGLANGFTCWQLYREALSPRFASQVFDKDLKGKLERQLKLLSPIQVAALIDQLLDVNSKMWAGGDEVLQRGLAQLKQKLMTGSNEDDEEEEEQPVVEEEPEPAAEEEEQQAVGKKRDRFFSKQTRKEALLNKSQAVAAQTKKTNGASTSRGATGAGRKAAANTPAARLAAWLLPALSKAFQALPSKLPGASVFTCSDVAMLGCLSAAPRDALHASLTQSHLFLGTTAGRAAQSDGLDAASEDACLAYQLLDQDPNCANVAEWFQSFSEVCKGAGKSAVTKNELAARFSQATSELQFVGLIKPSKRRRGDYVQRMVHMPAIGLQ